MLHKTDDFRGFTIGATDQQIGHVSDVLFDDESWSVRYVAVDTGSWLTGRTVLVAPRTVSDVHTERRVLVSTLTRTQVEASPPLERLLPITRPYETTLHDHYGWPYYWIAPPGLGTLPFPPAPPPDIRAPNDAMEAPHDLHLRKLSEIVGFGLEERDGELGYVDDTVIDPVTWIVRYVIVRMTRWLPEKKVMIDRDRVDEIDWVERKLVVDLDAWMIKDAPAFDEAMLHDPAYVRAIDSYFGSLSRHP